MKRKHKILITLLAVAVTVSLTTVPAFALTESEVQDQVNAVGKEVVTGNLFVWFLCAIAFLKVSQKIDSFMSSLGINVGHTGGSMLAEAICVESERRGLLPVEAVPAEVPPVVAEATPL